MSIFDRRYWVVGGIYRDTAFEEMMPESRSVMGPYRTRVEAESAWRVAADASRSECLARFSIAEEVVR
ncbi:MAG: hypothetical protein ACK4QW_05215 [Alphaproteobacteria bacterium]